MMGRKARSQTRKFARILCAQVMRSYMRIALLVTMAGAGVPGNARED